MARLPPTDPILTLDHVSYSYGERPALRKISLSLANGEFAGIIGPNGSGKSSILKVAAGILPPHSGEATLWGNSIRGYRGKDRAKLICYLPQMLEVNVPFRVRELVDMGLYPYDIPPGISPEDAIGIVGLTERQETFLTSLSGGELRRAFIAMTLVQGAGVVLLDEPLANLDIRYQIELIRLLKDLRERRSISILMALHDIHLAFQFERIFMVKEGELIASGPPSSVITSESLREAFGVTVTIDRRSDGTVSLGY